MSLTLSITNPKGIVLAADSRQTYANEKGALRIGSDTAEKIIPISNSMGVTIAGNVYLEPPTPERPFPTSIDNHILEFSQTVKEGEKVKNVAERLNKYLTDILKPEEQMTNMRNAVLAQIAQMGGKVLEEKTVDSQLVVTFLDQNNQQQFAQAQFSGGVELILAGYDNLGSLNAKQQAFRIKIPGTVEHTRKDNDVNQYGADWSGQGDVPARIIMGVDPQIGRLPFISFLHANGYKEQQFGEELKALQYRISWPSITLYDAIEFASLIIQTTAAVQRFSDGTAVDPGGIPGVGGAIDVAVIDPINGFQWYKHKLLELESPTFIQQAEVAASAKPTKPKSKS